MALLYATSVTTQLLFVAGGKDVEAFFVVSVVIQLVLFVAVWAVVPETGGKDFYSAAG